MRSFICFLDILLGIWDEQTNYVIKININSPYCSWLRRRHISSPGMFFFLLLFLLLTIQLNYGYRYKMGMTTMNTGDKEEVEDDKDDDRLKTHILSPGMFFFYFLFHY